MSQFNIFKKNIYMLKSYNTEGNTGRTASYFISMDAKYSSGKLCCRK